MLPRERTGRAGAEDLSIDIWRSRGRELNLRLDFPALRPNPGEGGRRRWAMLDSLARALCVLEQDGPRYLTSDPETGAPVHEDRRGRLFLQGRGAMAAPELEERHALVAFDARDRSALPAGASIVPYRMRAFVDRAALPGRLVGPAPTPPTARSVPTAERFT